MKNLFKATMLKLPLAAEFVHKLRNLILYCKYFRTFFTKNGTAYLNEESRVLVIGGSSDIAKPFLSILKSKNIRFTATTREASDGNTRLSNNVENAQFLDLSSETLIDDLNNLAMIKPFSHIISFVGKHDLGSVGPLQKPNEHIAELPDLIFSNAIGIFQVLQFLINENSEHYKSHHLSVSILTTSFALDRFPIGVHALGYRAGKTLLHILLKNFYLECRQSQINLTVLLCGPGYVKTKMTGYTGDIDREKSALILFRNIQKYGAICKMIYVSSLGKKKSLI